MTITALPDVPLNNDSPAAFAAKAARFVAALPQLVSEINNEVTVTIPAIVSTVAGAAGMATGTTIPGHVSAVDAAKSTAINTTIPAAVALVDTAVAATAAGSATAAMVCAEAARDLTELYAQAAASSAGIYDSVAIGRGISASITGPTSFFQVKKGGLGPDDLTPLTRQTMYQRTGAGTQTALYAILPADEFDSVLPNIPAVFESLDPALKQANIVLDPARRIVAQFPDPVLGALKAMALTSAVYETLDTQSANEVWLCDPTGRIILRFADAASVASLSSVSALLSEMAASRGTRTSLSARLAKGLTPHGDVLGPYANAWATREIRMRLQQLALGEAAQLVITAIGDSYTAGGYHLYPLAKYLQTTYGSAGAGWIGFPWWGTAAGTWTAGSQPVGVDGNVRPDVITLVQIIGTWTCSYNTAANNTPSLGKVTSTTAGDYIRFTVPAGHNVAQLFYAGDGTGVVQVSWDDGASYGANIALNTVGTANVSLAGVPATAQIARIKVISGSVALAGVDLRSASSGVRIHKLGASGSATNTWSTVNAATWGAQLRTLGGHAHIVMFGTNDQGASFSTATFKSNLAMIWSNLTTARPSADKVLAMPPENQRTTNAVAMSAYSAAARELAVDSDIAFIDMQYFFGSTENFAYAYAWANTSRQWYGSDLVHPVASTGGRVMADAFRRLFTQH